MLLSRDVGRVHVRVEPERSRGILGRVDDDEHEDAYDNEDGYRVEQTPDDVTSHPAPLRHSPIQVSPPPPSTIYSLPPGGKARRYSPGLPPNSSYLSTAYCPLQHGRNTTCRS